MNTTKSKLSRWAGEDEGYKVLQFIAESLLKEIRNIDALAVSYPSCSDNSSHQTLKEEITHDFYIFLMDYFIPRLHKHPEQLYLIETGNFRKLLHLAKYKFICQLREKRRSKNTNPAGYLYRRLRQTISDAPLFETKNLANLPFLYRLRTNKTPEQYIRTVFSDDDFSSWPLLPMRTNTPEKEIFTAGFLINSAHILWKEANKRTDVSFLALNDLSRYIFSQYPWLLHPVATQQLPEISSVNNTEDELDTITFLKSMEVLAEQLVATWSDRQRKIFLMRMNDSSLKWKDLARQFGTPDHNRIYRDFSFCKKSLNEFTTNWPGPPLSDLPDICEDVFLEKIIEECKKLQKSP